MSLHQSSIDLIQSSFVLYSAFGGADAGRQSEGEGCVHTHRMPRGVEHEGRADTAEVMNFHLGCLEPVLDLWTVSR